MVHLEEELKKLKYSLDDKHSKEENEMSDKITEKSENDENGDNEENEYAKDWMES